MRGWLSDTWTDCVYEWRAVRGWRRPLVALQNAAALLRVFFAFLPSGASPMRNVGRDLRYAFRRLRQTPVFSTFAVVTLALGIGAATAVYSVVHAVALKAPAIDDVERVVKVYHSSGGSGPMTSFSWPDINDLKARQTSFTHLATWSRLSHAITLPEGSRPFHGELVDGERSPEVPQFSKFRCPRGSEVVGVPDSENTGTPETSELREPRDPGTSRLELVYGSPPSLPRMARRL